jgi:hypothetical protein
VRVLRRPETKLAMAVRAGKLSFPAIDARALRAAGGVKGRGEATSAASTPLTPPDAGGTDPARTTVNENPTRSRSVLTARRHVNAGLPHLVL